MKTFRVHIICYLALRLSFIFLKDNHPKTGYSPALFHFVDINSINLNKKDRKRFLKIRIGQKRPSLWSPAWFGLGKKAAGFCWGRRRRGGEVGWVI